MTATKALAKLKQLEKALASFRLGVIDNPSEIERDGAIQRFEYSFELSWKTLKTVLEYLGVEDCKSPRKHYKPDSSRDLSKWMIRKYGWQC